jgi:hypothetical protein
VLRPNRDFILFSPLSRARRGCKAVGRWDIIVPDRKGQPRIAGWPYS